MHIHQRLLEVPAFQRLGNICLHVPLQSKHGKEGGRVRDAEGAKVGIGEVGNIKSRHCQRGERPRTIFS